MGFFFYLSIFFNCFALKTSCRPVPKYKNRHFNISFQANENSFKSQSRSSLKNIAELLMQVKISKDLKFELRRKI